MRRWRRRGLPRPLFLVGGLLLLLALGAGVRLAEAQRHLRAAELAFTEAKTAVGETRTDDAAAALDDAQAELDAAASQTGAFPLNVLRPIPLLGSPTKAVADVTDAGTELVAAGRVVNEAAELFPTSGAVAVDGHDLSAFHDAAVGAEAALVEAEAHVRTAADIVDGPAGAMLPQLSSPARSLAGTIDDALTQLGGAERGLALLADLTAPTTDARILVLSQDTYELRPTGGFAGSYGILEFRNGRVELTEYDDSHALPEAEPPMEPPPFLAGHLPNEWELENALWWPHFPTSAENAVEMFRRQRGIEVDGVVAMTDDVIARIVGAIGPVQVPGYDEPVVEEGFADRVVYETGLKRPLDTPRKRFTIELSKVVLEKLFDLQPDEMAAVAGRLRENRPGDLQLWFPTDDRQRLVAGSAFSGEMPTYDRDVLMVVDANLTASKANRGLTREITYRPRWDREEKRYVGQLRMSYVNDDPESEYVNPYYNGFVRIYAPAGAELLPGEDNARFAPIGREGDFEVFGGWVMVRPEERVEVEVEYWLPDTVDGDGRTYGLTWRRQPGTSRDTLVAHVGSTRHLQPPEATTLELEAGLRDHPVREFLHDRWITRQLGF